MRSSDIKRPMTLVGIAALALGGVLVAPGTAAASTGASAGASTGISVGIALATSPSDGVDYTCTASLGLLPVSVPLHIDALQTVTAPAGAQVSGLTATAGLTGLVNQLAELGLSTVFGASSLVLGVGHDLQVGASIDPTGTLGIPSFTVPASAEPGSTVPVTAPQSFLLDVAAGALGSVSCALDDTGSDVLGTVLVGPAVTDTTIHSAQPPVVDDGVPTTLSVDAVLGAHFVARVIRAGRHARLKVSVVPAGAGTTARRVTIRSAGRLVGHAQLVKRAVTVRLALMSPGRHTVTVRVAGLSRQLTLRVVPGRAAP